MKTKMHCKPLSTESLSSLSGQWKEINKFGLWTFFLKVFLWIYLYANAESNQVNLRYPCLFGQTSLPIFKLKDSALFFFCVPELICIWTRWPSTPPPDCSSSSAREGPEKTAAVQRRRGHLRGILHRGAASGLGAVHQQVSHTTAPCFG